MTSSKLILIFLGFIFLIIVILSSNRIAGSLRTRFGKFLPSIKRSAETISPTPTPTFEVKAKAPTPTVVYGEKIGDSTTIPNGEIPATGPADLFYIVIGGSLLAGLSLKKLTTTTTWR